MQHYSASLIRPMHTLCLAESSAADGSKLCCVCCVLSSWQVNKRITSAEYIMLDDLPLAHVWPDGCVEEACGVSSDSEAWDSDGGHGSRCVRHVACVHVRN